MEEIIDFELEFRNSNLFPAELIFKFDEFVLKLDPEFPLVVKVIFEFFFSFFKLFPFILEHEFYFAEIMVITIAPLI